MIYHMPVLLFMVYVFVCIVMNLNLQSHF